MTLFAPSWRTRWWRAVEAHPNALILGLVLVLAPFALLLVWLQMGRWEDKQIGAAVQRAGQALDVRHQQAVIDFTHVMEGLKGLPEFMAAEPRLIRALEQPKNPAYLRAAEAYLGDVTEFSGANFALLLDTQGRALTGHFYDSRASVAGLVFADREYFRMAMAGQAGHQFAVGRMSGSPGIFFSYPVRSTSARVLGVVAIKLDLVEIASRIRLAGVFVVDEQGVVILAPQREMLFKALADAPIFKTDVAFRRQRYLRTNFPVLTLQSARMPAHPEIQLFGEPAKPVLHRQIEMSEDRMSIHLIEELNELPALKANHLLVLGIAWLAVLAGLWAVCATAVFVLRVRQFRTNIEAAHAELLLLNDRLKHQAESDFLTGCMNRRRFDEELGQEIRRSQRQKYPLTLALMDLDHFKRINDSFGHLIGDAALQHFASVLRGHIRQTDRFARIGGEEFALLMPDTSPAAAMPLIERLRQSIADAPLPLASGASLSVTASIGVANLCFLDDHDALFQRADNAMYEAKSSGRNQAIFAPCPGGVQEILAFE